MSTRNEAKEHKGSPAAAIRQPKVNGELPCLVRMGAELEDLPPRHLEEISPRAYEKEYYHVNARNALRCLTYGTPLLKGSPYTPANLKLAWINFKALFLKRDKKQLNALREELKYLIENAYDVLRDCDPATEQRLELFINTLMSNFPFMDPVEGETLFLPQKINNQWRLIPYTFTRIDISPRTGLLSKLIEDEDRIYAFGLEPQVAQADPYLLLMGTTYFSGQGAHLSLLGDLSAGKSVGERHDHTQLEQWILKHRNIKVSGHSQGGTMSMIVAAKYPDHIRQVYALNPTALHQSTLKKLTPGWLARKSNTQIHVYTQSKDPVFIIGDGFFPGTRFFHIDHPNSERNSKFAAHAHHYLGRKVATYHEIPGLPQQNSNKRKFYNDIKAAADSIYGPLLTANFVYRILKRKLFRFCTKHENALKIALFAALLITSIAMIASGVLTIPGLIAAGPLVHYGALALGGLAVSLAGTILAPTLGKLAARVVEFTAGIAVVIGGGINFVLRGIVAGFQALKRACLPKKFEEYQGPQNKSTGASLMQLLSCKPSHSRASGNLPRNEAIDSRLRGNDRSRRNDRSRGNDNGRNWLTTFSQPSLQPNPPAHSDSRPAPRTPPSRSH